MGNGVGLVLGKGAFATDHVVGGQRGRGRVEQGSSAFSWSLLALCRGRCAEKKKEAGKGRLRVRLAILASRGKYRVGGHMHARPVARLPGLCRLPASLFFLLPGVSGFSSAHLALSSRVRKRRLASGQAATAPAASGAHLQGRGCTMSRLLLTSLSRIPPVPRVARGLLVARLAAVLLTWSS